MICPSMHGLVTSASVSSSGSSSPRQRPIIPGKTEQDCRLNLPYIVRTNVRAPDTLDGQAPDIHHFFCGFHRVALHLNGEGVKGFRRGLARCQQHIDDGERRQFRGKWPEIPSLIEESRRDHPSSQAKAVLHRRWRKRPKASGARILSS